MIQVSELDKGQKLWSLSQYKEGWEWRWFCQGK